MIGTLLAVTLYTTFRFPGGSDCELVEAIDRSCGKPSAILAEPRRKWKKTEFAYVAGDANDLFRILNAKLPVDAGGKPNSLSGAEWPRFMFDKGVPAPKAPWGLTAVKLRIAGGKIDASCDGPAQLETLVAGLSKPCAFHWFFKDAFLTISAHGASEKDYVQVIANALGAKLVDEPKRYRFEINPTILRRRAESLCRNIVSSEQSFFLRALAHLTGEAISRASDAEISSCYQDLGNTVVLVGSDEFGLQAACRDYVQACFPANGNTPFPSIDFSRPCKVLLYASGHAATRWKSTDPKIGAIVTLTQPSSLTSFR